LADDVKISEVEVLPGGFSATRTKLGSIAPRQQSGKWAKNGYIIWEVNPIKFTRNTQTAETGSLAGNSVDHER
jgi:hypothetical protein